MTTEYAAELFNSEIKNFKRLDYSPKEAVQEYIDAMEMAIKALEQKPCEMTAEEYRQRMIQAFHNVDCDELIAICVLPTEKEFEYLERLLRSHYKKEPCEDPGEISDGYHTFNQLYHQRAILFATIVNQNKNKAWKSFKHSDGKYCFDSNGEWFIVGVDTPQGSYTYHYAKKYWDMFDCEELECGKEWDGHTEEDVTRLLSLEQELCDDCISRQAAIDAMVRIEHDDIARYGCAIPEGFDSDPAIEALNGLPSVTPQPKTSYISIDDVMSVFDDFMCGEVDEDGTDVFLEMLKDRVESEEV